MTQNRDTLLGLLAGLAVAAIALPVAAQPEEPPLEEEPPDVEPPPPVVEEEPVAAPEPEPEPEPDIDTPVEDEAEAASEDDEGAEAPAPETGFRFGSYGRVSVASDLDGRVGRDADIVAHGPRIDEGVYAELELRRHDAFGDHDEILSRIVATIAVSGELFHFNGEFEEAFAIRNLFAEVEGLFAEGFALWAGSRMVRGDDIYLLDFWPLDNLNMVGGGTRYRIRDIAELALSFGWARPEDPFQHQIEDAVQPGEFLPEEVVVLDRPRLVIAAKATWFPLGHVDDGLKLVLYGESHHLPSGQREGEGGLIERLPSDSGYVIGAQVGGWMVGSHAFANLFIRFAHGLGAYDPLGVPFRVGTVIETDRAREILIGLSANYEYEWLGLQVGAYYRNFRDADPSVFERTRLAEGAFVVRPHFWFGRYAGIAAEVSYQALDTTSLDEVTGQTVRGGVTKLGLIPFVTPGGRGTYTRPHLRLIYSLTLRDADARRLYPDRDARSRERTEHFLGVGAEWWFDSTSYQ